MYDSSSGATVSRGVLGGEVSGEEVRSTLLWRALSRAFAVSCAPRGRDHIVGQGGAEEVEATDAWSPGFDL